MMDWKIAIPTYKRWGAKFFTLKILNSSMAKRALLFVNNKRERDEYIKCHGEYEDRIIVTNVKGITKTRNFILDYFVGKKVLIMDDDIKSFCLWSKFYGDRIYLNRNMDFLESFINNCFKRLIYCGSNLFGIYPTDNYLCMKKQQSLSYYNFIIGDFMGIIVDDIRFDEELLLKEDYDFTLQHIFRYGKILRFNKIGMDVCHYKNSGGCVDYRTKDKEQEAIKYLKHKWGSIIMKGRNDNEIKLNTVAIKKKLELGRG